MDEKTRRKLKMKFEKLMIKNKRLSIATIVLSIALIISMLGNGFFGYMVWSNHQDKIEMQEKITLLEQEKEAEAQKVEQQRLEEIQNIYLASNWLVSIWNDQIVEISSYTAAGLSSDGSELDINTIIANLESSYANKDGHNNVINDLNNSSYSTIKTSWNNALEQLAIIYNQVMTTIPEPNTEIEYRTNIEAFEAYMLEFSNQATNMYNNQ